MYFSNFDESFMNENDEDNDSNDDEVGIIEFEIKNECSKKWDNSDEPFEIQDALNADSTLTCVALSIASTVLPTTFMLDSKKLWIADTGATSHVTKYANGGKNQCKSMIKMRGCSNDSMIGTFEMNIPVKYCKRAGEELRSANLNDMQVNERFNFNLFSMTKILLKGYKLKGDEKSITIFKGEVSFVFDAVIKMRHGALFCAFMKRILMSEPEISNISVEAEERLEKRNLKTIVKQAHECLGHLSKAMTRVAAMHLGMMLSHGALPVCKLCAMAKAQQCNIPKIMDED